MNKIDIVIFSPPYASQNHAPPNFDDPTAGKNGRRYIGMKYSDNQDNLGNLPYGD